jgi:hypothetical protein
MTPGFRPALPYLPVGFVELLELLELLPQSWAYEDLYWL